MNNIIVRFDDVSADRRLICYATLVAIPDVGETININGNPFKVVKRGWAVDVTTTESPVHWKGLCLSKLYAYVDCVP